MRSWTPTPPASLGSIVDGRLTQAVRTAWVRRPSTIEPSEAGGVGVQDLIRISFPRVGCCL